MRILVAEDDATSRLITKMALQSVGHECQTVSDGASAWDAFQVEQAGRRHQRLGDAGPDRARALPPDSRSIGHLHVLHPRHGPGQPRADARRDGGGADDYLIKPLNSEDLSGPSGRGCAGHRVAQPAGRPEAAVGRAEPRAHRHLSPRFAHGAREPDGSRGGPPPAGRTGQPLRAQVLPRRARRGRVQGLQRHVRAPGRRRRPARRWPAS